MRSIPLSYVKEKGGFKYMFVVYLLGVVSGLIAGILSMDFSMDFLYLEKLSYSETNDNKDHEN